MVFPDTLLQIGDAAFEGNGDLVSITLPASIQIIGWRAFYQTGLDIINYKGDEYQWNALGNTTLASLVRLNVGTSLAPTLPITERNGTTTTPTTTPEVTTPTVTTPTTPSESTSVIATPSTAKVMVNGAEVPFGSYNIDGYNYFKLTDISFSIFGTEKQFKVSWDAEKNAINMLLGEGHTVLGTELAANSGRNELADLFTSPIYCDGRQVNPTVYVIDGSSYFQLASLVEILGITVGWDNATSTITITT